MADPATVLAGASVATSLLGSRGRNKSTQTSTPSYGWMTLPSGAKIWAQTGGSTTETTGGGTSAWDAAASGLGTLSSVVSADQVSDKLVDAVKSTSKYKTTSFTPEYFKNSEQYKYNTTKLV